MQYGREVGIAGDEAEAIADTEVLGGGFEFEPAVFRAESLDGDVVTSDDLGGGELGVVGLATGVDDGTVRYRTTDDGGDNRECVGELLDLTDFAVEDVHEDETAGLQLRDAGASDGGFVRTGAAGGNDVAGEVRREYRVASADKVFHRFGDAALLFLGIGEGEEMALVSHDACEVDVRRGVDLTGETDGGIARRDAGAGEADIDLDDGANTGAGLGERLVDGRNLIGVIERHDEVGAFGEFGEAGSLDGADDLIGDEDVTNAGSGHDLGLAELGAGDADGAGVDEAAGDFGGFMGF